MTAPFSIDEYVRWGDIDAAGVICYGAYMRFIEIAETELFRAVGMPYGEVFNRFDCWLPRVRLCCEFRAPARLDERLSVQVFVKRLGTTSMTLGFRISKAGGVRAADCELVLVCVDRAAFSPKPVPQELRAALTPFLE
ncbi:MAG: acyl-CoA thioesterase [Candidatus Eremiobacteraeota bacterium]|nr:acyl-CoA thioesterase [Candidatus Eremiobacteraeota bacterium]MBC5828304.1 acyl-CoA thioesterase [Candidatus Eremiobacteraeota bacterium]